MARLCLWLQSGRVLLFSKFIKIKTSRFISAETWKKLSLDHNCPKLNQKLHFLKSGCSSAPCCFLSLNHQAAEPFQKGQEIFFAFLLKLLPELPRWQTCRITHLSPGNTPTGVLITLHTPNQNSAMLCNSAAINTKPDKHTLTNFPGDLGERLHTTLPIVAFRSQCWDIVPPQGCHDVDHGLCLVGVGRDHAREVVIPGVIAQLRSCRCIADLRYLQTEPQVMQANLITFYSTYLCLWKACNRLYTGIVQNQVSCFN